jgi:hypothetical protein
LLYFREIHTGEVGSDLSAGFAWSVVHGFVFWEVQQASVLCVVYQQ